jgi:hypothetical protein
MAGRNVKQMEVETLATEIQTAYNIARKPQLARKTHGPVFARERARALGWVVDRG